MSASSPESHWERKGVGKGEDIENAPMHSQRQVPNLNHQIRLQRLLLLLDPPHLRLQFVRLLLRDVRRGLLARAPHGESRRFEEGVLAVENGELATSQLG